MTSEFDLIRKYFVYPAPGTVLGPGDDCALMAPQPGMQIAVSTDLLLEGRHFLPHTDPFRLGRKSAAVNLSDLAAMGAAPRWTTLALALPVIDEDWVAAFARGFHQELAAHGADWVGGDTTAGPLTIGVTVIGEVPPGQALRRSGARPGDDLWVSGTIGDAALGLRCLRQGVNLPYADRAHCVDRQELPEPRVTLGLALRGVAHAAIDLSDGLLGDLGHLLAASGVGAEIELEALPLSPALTRARALPDWLDLVVAGGDDYELCFAAAPEDRRAVQEAAAKSGVNVARVGCVTEQQERVLRNGQGLAVDIPWRGFDHFLTP